jgi:hypothetical protein
MGQWVARHGRRWVPIKGLRALDGEHSGRCRNHGCVLGGDKHPLSVVEIASLPPRGTGAELSILVDNGGRPRFVIPGPVFARCREGSH